MLIKISKMAAVNPKHVVSILRNSKTLSTDVILIGMAKVPSDYDFEETLKRLNAEEN